MLLGYLPICTAATRKPPTTGSANQGSAKIVVQPKGFGWAWFGVGALTVIGIAAVVYADDHEYDFEAQKQ